MDYLYENLGDERFQEFCNCLVAKEFPDFQSFPVGQRDGGRDSLAYNMQSTKKDYIVFQVKFVRNPQKINDIHKWLTEIIWFTPLQPFQWVGQKLLLLILP